MSQPQATDYANLTRLLDVLDQSDSRSADTLIDLEERIQAIELTTTFATEGIASIGVECAF